MVKRQPIYAEARRTIDYDAIRPDQLELPLSLASKHRLSDRESRYLVKHYNFLCRQFRNAHKIYGSLADLLYNVDPTEERKRGFFMLNVEQWDRISDEIMAGPHPNATARVWLKATGKVDWQTGEILRTRKEIAAKARVTPAMVSRAMVLLEGYGAIIRDRDGGTVRYRCNPLVGWPSGDPGDPRRRQMSNYQALAIGMFRRMKDANDAEAAEPSLGLAR